MKTEQFKELQKKYFEGTASSEEIKKLKDMDPEGLFSVLKEEKNEQMNWSFDDFINEMEDNKIVPLHKISPKKGMFPKFVWLAASLVLLFGLYFGYGLLKLQSNMQETDTQIAHQIAKQRVDFQKENAMVASTHPDSLYAKTDSISLDSTSNGRHIADNTDDTDLMDKILSKKGRLKKNVRTKYTYHQTTPEKAKVITQYQENFVIINGQKIQNEKEAIDITRYSMQLLSEKVSKTIATTVILENPTE